MSYPTLENVNFQEKIYKKREFYEITQLDAEPDIFQFTLSQFFAKFYINKHTPYRSVLLYHGTGMGKTCAAVQIADNFIQQNSIQKEVLIITPASLIDNMMSELSGICGKSIQDKGDWRRFIDIVSKDGRTLIGLIKKIESNPRIDLEYLQTHMNDVTKLKKIRAYLKNKLIIVDEAHLIFGTEGDTLAAKVFDIFISLSTNCRLVLLTATPMYNQPIEIITILNVLLKNDGRKPLNHTDYFSVQDGQYVFKSEMEDQLRLYLNGYISYAKFQSKDAYPQKLMPAKEKRYLPSAKYAIQSTATEFKKNTPIQYNYLYRCVPEEIQLRGYFNQLFQLEKVDNLEEYNDDQYKENEENEENEENDIGVDISLKYKNVLTYVSNIVFPSLKTNVNEFRKYFKYKTMNKVVMYNVSEKAMMNVDDEQLFFMDYDILDNYSIKFKELLTSIAQNEGIHFIHVQHKRMGLELLRILFDYHGMKELSIENSSVENYNIRYNPKILDISMNETELNEQNEVKKSVFSGIGYVALAGVSSRNERDKALSILNDPRNKNGEYVKVIIGTDVLATGITFKNVRQEHILNPWYNMSKIEQIEGRGIRNQSHRALPNEKRNVTVNIYALSMPTDDEIIQKEIDVQQVLKKKNKKWLETETFDEYVHGLAEKKDIVQKKIEKIIVEQSADCMLFYPVHKKHIVPSGDLPTRECYYEEKCEYKCTGPSTKLKPEQLNVGTFVEQPLTIDHGMVLYQSIVSKIKKILVKKKKMTVEYLLREVFAGKENLVYNSYLLLRQEPFILYKDIMYRIDFEGDILLLRPMSIKDSALDYYINDYRIRVFDHYMLISTDIPKLNKKKDVPKKKLLVRSRPLSFDENVSRMVFDKQNKKGEFNVIFDEDKNEYTLVYHKIVNGTKVYSEKANETHPMLDFTDTITFSPQFDLYYGILTDKKKGSKESGVLTFKLSENKPIARKRDGRIDKRKLLGKTATMFELNILMDLLKRMKQNYFLDQTNTMNRSSLPKEIIEQLKDDITKEFDFIHSQLDILDDYKNKKYASRLLQRCYQFCQNILLDGKTWMLKENEYQLFIQNQN